MTFLVSAKQLHASSDKARHKVALKLLTKAVQGHYASLQDYRYVEDLLMLQTIDMVDTKKISDRLYLHREMSGASLSETNLPFQVINSFVRVL